MSEKTVFALGFFDGVHLGHQALLKQCREMADKLGCRAGVVTFTSHPDALVRGRAPALLNTAADRKTLLTRYNMDTVLELAFDQYMMNTPWQDFLRLLVDSCNAAGLVCGEDFRFGARGLGTAALLQEACGLAGLPCAVVPQQKLDGITVSSSYIRTLLEQGQAREAARFLGHPHLLSGTVITGRRLGRTIGFPTANVLLPPEILVPRHGVYACKAVVEEGTFLAVTNVGTRPTVGGSQVTVEVSLLDFQDDLYGAELELHFYEFLRPEQKFASLAELKQEIAKNQEQTRKILENS